MLPEGDHELEDTLVQVGQVQKTCGVPFCHTTFFILFLLVQHTSMRFLDYFSVFLANRACIVSHLVSHFICLLVSNHADFNNADGPRTFRPNSISNGLKPSVSIGISL